MNISYTFCCVGSTCRGLSELTILQRSVDLPNDRTPCYHVLLDIELVAPVNVKQVESLR